MTTIHRATSSNLMQLSNRLDDDLADDLTPATLFVYWILIDAGPLTTAELENKTTLHPSTIRDGLKRLQEHDLINTQRDVDDLRKRQYLASSEGEQTKKQSQREALF